MTRHRIRVRSMTRGVSLPPELKALLKKAAAAALAHEDVKTECEVNIFYTDDEGMRALNRDQRGLDKPTDVLSFPMLDIKPGQTLCAGAGDIDRESGALWLGDVVLSRDRLYEQAERYGHSPEREGAFLTVHACLHLLGYDHEQGAGQEKTMFCKTEEILSGLGLGR